MIKEIDITLTPQENFDSKLFKDAVAKKSGVKKGEITFIQRIKQSIDARSREIKINCSVKVYVGEKPKSTYKYEYNYQNVSNKAEVIIIGSGPAGLFAALRLIELGLKPIVLEKGAAISDRKKHIAALCQNKELNIDSNYCFGEGGAGTFSDGKLFTRSKKRGNTDRILEIFHQNGAQDEILYEAHPHIGTNVLPTVVQSMCAKITECGGEIYFNHKVIDIDTTNDQFNSVTCSNGTKFSGKALILASGHSSREIYQLLHQKSILIEAKGFAMGLRIEHKQELINNIQYGNKAGADLLPAAKYNLVEQVDGRGVYSFCMCPGGHIVPSATTPQSIVVNGMSNSQRNSPYANSAIVVEYRPEDFGTNPLDGLNAQEALEHLAFNNNGGGLQTAPAQRVADFVKGRLSADLPDSTYLPGLISSPLHFWLPEHFGKRLRDGIKIFDKRMKGFLTNDAVVVGVETRTSSPIRIPRDKETFEHPQIKGLFPCGEGAGYAGGITSCAVDGENCAEKLAMIIGQN